MNLKWVNIENYRSCKNIPLEFGAMHALVGANNSGKSNIIRGGFQSEVQQRKLLKQPAGGGLGFIALGPAGTKAMGRIRRGANTALCRIGTITALGLLPSRALSSVTAVSVYLRSQR